MPPPVSTPPLSCARVIESEAATIAPEVAHDQAAVNAEGSMLALSSFGVFVGGVALGLGIGMACAWGTRKYRRNLFIRALGRWPKHLSKRGRVIRAAGILLMPLVVGFMVYMSGLRFDPYSLRGLGAMLLVIGAPLYLVSILQHRFGTEGGGGSDSPSAAKQEASRRT